MSAAREAARGGLFALLLLVLLSTGHDSTVTMKSSELFNRLELQLLHPPPSSDAVLAQAAQGQLVPRSVALVPARDSPYLGFSTGWREFSRPTTTVCVAFPEEESAFDVVRCRYPVGDLWVDFAASVGVWSLRITGPALPDEVDARSATECAERVFGRDSGVQLRQLGRQEETIFGVQDTDVAGLAGDHDGSYRLHWRDVLK